MATELKRNKSVSNDDIFTQVNLDSVTNYLRMVESTPLKQQKQLKAKEFPSNHEWFNSAPISIDDLMGKITLIDFWTYCCINCLHVQPDLEFLEQKFAGE